MQDTSSPDQCGFAFHQDAEILRKELTHSTPDLYLAKLKLEERLKAALNFDFGFESPLVYIKRFFECAFSPSEQSLESIKKWREDTESLVGTCSYMPLSQWIHPVFLAAAFLQWNKQNMIQSALDNGEKQPDLPENIGGHPWFMYVDPGVDAKSMVYISQTIDEEFKFLVKFLSSDEEGGDAKLDVEEAESQ